MPVLMELEMQITPDQYDAVNAALNPKGDPPPGLIAHSARFDGDTFKALDIWESEEAFAEFAQSRLGPTIGETLGDEAPAGPPEPKFTQLHNAYSV
jgi:heme-degrading monooxygenase HmoA